MGICRANYLRILLSINGRIAPHGAAILIKLVSLAIRVEIIRCQYLILLRLRIMEWEQRPLPPLMAEGTQHHIIHEWDSNP